MFALNLPEAWEIEQLERMRRTPEEGSREIAQLPLVPELEPARDVRVPPARRVIVIQVW